MSDNGSFVRNEIIYEEGWRGRAPVPEEEPPSESAPAGEAAPADGHSLPLLISIQLALCAAAAAVLFIMKVMDSEAYHSFMTAYRVEMNKPVISQELFEALDIRKLTGGDGVTVKASPDELPPR